MILYFNKKLTVNELAKYLVADQGSTATYWGEFTGIDVNKMTLNEINLVDAAVNKHIERIEKFLGMDKIYNKLQNKA